MKRKNLKKGLVVKAKWNGEPATVMDIKEGNVFYTSQTTGKKVYEDTIETFLECFVIYCEHKKKATVVVASYVTCEETFTICQDCGAQLSIKKTECV